MQFGSFSHRAVAASRRVAPAAEYGLDLAALLLVPILVMAPRGVAALAVVAGVLAAIRALSGPATSLRPVLLPAGLLAVLVGWGLLSMAWSIHPAASLVLALRLAGMFAAVVALAIAAGTIDHPQRLFGYFVGGLALGLILMAVELASHGALTRPFFRHPFAETGLNQASDALAILLLPTAAALIARRRFWLGLAVAAGMIAAIFVLEGTAAKTSLIAGLAFAAVLYWRPARPARLIALVAAIAIVTAPLTLPLPARIPAVLHSAGAFKSSAAHRLLIWSFVGDRIAERPFLGWGLDSSRAIPGGQNEIQPGQAWLPLHPHDAALQLWLELGAPGAALFATLVALLWLRLAAAAWSRRFAAAAGGSLLTALVASFGTYGIWQEWWLGTLGMALFLILAMARFVGATAAQPAPCWRSSQASSTKTFHSG